MDVEIDRLRRLRARALQVRAVARALARTKAGNQDPLLQRGRCAAWRVTRAASGHLRSHPCLSYQRDAGVGTILMNGVIAAGAALRSMSRPAALAIFESHLNALSRELDDARALTRAAALSDTLGRSQAEIRVLLKTLRDERVSGRQVAGAAGAAAASVRDADWPYLAF